MATWVLIMTMVTGGLGSTVASLPNFTSIEACQDAGMIWKADIDTNHSWGRVNSRFVCVSTVPVQHNASAAPQG